jgi:hypothetical protein
VPHIRVGSAPLPMSTAARLGLRLRRRRPSCRGFSKPGWRPGGSLVGSSGPFRRGSRW